MTFAGGTTYYACGNSGIILKSTDSGANWALQTSNTVFNLLGIFAISTSVAWACGVAGTIQATTDGGTNWSSQTSGQTVDMNAVHAVDANTAWMVTNWDSGPSATKVMNTTDGGANWNVVSIPQGTSIKFLSVFFISTTVGWLCGQEGLIYKSTDGGSVWVLQTSGVNDRLEGIAFQSTSLGWVVGDNGVILNTTDGGATWTEQTSGTSARLLSIAVIDANDVNIGGDGFTIMDTVDGGTTWTQPAAAWALTLEYIGRYRVYARIKKSSTGSGQMRVSSGWAGGSVLTNAQVDVVAGSSLQTVFLGEISIPATRISGEQSPTPIIKVEGQMDAGSETWSSDVFWIVPVDSLGETVEIVATATDSSHIIIDSDTNAINKGSTIVTWIGSPILLRPGRNNLVLCETTAITGAIITVKYIPLYLLPVA